jgi:hypothetical protein
MKIWGRFGEIHNHKWTNGLTAWPRVQAPDNRIHIYIYSHTQIPNPQTKRRHNTIIVQIHRKVGQGQAG